MNTKVSVKEKICYGIGSGGGNIITQILGTFLTAYYTDSVGIAAAAVGTMMLVARLLDGISDVMMGGIVDKTRTKWGKARPWILISAPVICIGLILTFNVPESLSSSAKLIYAYITYVFLNCIAFTAYMISHTALLSRVTLDVNDRQSMTSINQIVNNIVQLIVNGSRLEKRIYRVRPAHSADASDLLLGSQRTSGYGCRDRRSKSRDGSVKRSSSGYFKEQIFLPCSSIIYPGTEHCVRQRIHDCILLWKYFKRHEHDDTTFYGTDTSGYYWKLFCTCNR